MTMSRGGPVSYVVEVRMKRKDGDYAWIRDAGEIVERAEDDKPTRMIGVQTDVTESKAFVDQASILSSAIEAATTGVVLAGIDGKVTHANHALYEMLGYDSEAEDLMGVDLNYALADEFKEQFEHEIMPAVMQGGWRGDIQLVRKDGMIIDIDASLAPVHDESGNVITISAMVSDITEQREMEAILQEQNQAMMEMSTPVITLWDEIVLLPLVGTIDDDRAMQMTERLLEAIVSFEARVAILDVTGGRRDRHECSPEPAEGRRRRQHAGRACGCYGLQPERGPDIGSARRRFLVAEDARLPASRHRPGVRPGRASRRGDCGQAQTVVFLHLLRACVRPH